MSCNVTKIDLCFLVAETFKKPHFKFNVEVLKDQFLYVIKDRSGEVFRATQEDNIELSANDIYITNIDLKIGEYTHELIWTRNGISRLIFQGKVNVMTTAFDSCCDDSELSSSDIVLIDDQTVYEITFSQGEDGKDGINGKDGEPGPKGEDGPKGEQGEQGERGEQGTRGEKGVQGDVGKQGEKGEAGQNIIDQNTKNPLMVWTGTKAQYDAVIAKDPATLYIIKP